MQFPFTCKFLMKQKAALCISRSVLVSVVFEKKDEQGVEDCLSVCLFSNLWIPENFAGIS